MKALRTIAADPNHLGAENGTIAYLGEPLGSKRLLARLRAREWWVYAKRPFGGPEQVLAI